jgi:hypothetical protein
MSLCFQVPHGPVLHVPHDPDAGRVAVCPSQLCLPSAGPQVLGVGRNHERVESHPLTVSQHPNQDTHTHTHLGLILLLWILVLGGRGERGSRSPTTLPAGSDVGTTDGRSGDGDNVSTTSAPLPPGGGRARSGIGFSVVTAVGPASAPAQPASLKSALGPSVTPPAQNS